MYKVLNPNRGSRHIPLPERDRSPSPVRKEYTTSDGSKVRISQNDLNKIRATKAVGRFANHWSEDKMSNDDLINKISSSEVNSIIPNKRDTSPNRKMTAAEQLREARKKEGEEKHERYSSRSRSRTRFSEPGTPADIPVRQRTPLRARSVDRAEERVPSTRREEQRDSGELLAMQKQASEPKGILKKPKGSLLDTINSIRSNPEELFKERERAVSSNERSDRIRSKSIIRFDRDRQKVDTARWANPPEHYEDEPIEELPVRAPIERKGVLDKNMKLPNSADSTDTKFGLPWEQQMRKGVAEAAIQEASRPYEPYLRPTVADLSEGERRAEQMSAYMNPFTNLQSLSEENDIEDRIINAGEMPGSVQSAAPYMKAFSKNPADMHEELVGPMERAQLASIREESDQNLYDKLLPELKRKYMVPGMKRSGHLNKELKDVAERYSKGREHAINQAMTQNRLGTLGVAQKHTSLQGNAAQQAGIHALDDVKKEMATPEMLYKAKEMRRIARKEAIAETESHGVKNRAVRQHKMNADEAAFEEAQQHEAKQIGKLAAINSGLGTKGFYSENKLRQLRGNPMAGENNLATRTGNALASMARGQMPNQGQYAKGGLIKTRCKKAAGGQIMQEAVNNAVIDRDDPLTALRRLMNRQRMMDVSESKIGRRRYRDGGSVDPIQAGASQARQLLGEKDLRAHIESQKTPYAKPRITSMVDDFMRGFGHGGGTSGLAGMANAWNETGKSIDDEHAAGLAQKDKAFRDTYSLDQNAKAEEAKLRREAREERKFLSDEKYKKALLAQKENKPLKLSRADNELLAQNTKMLTAAPDLLDDLARMKELSKKLKTGEMRGKLAGQDAYWLAKAGVGDQADIEEYIKLSNSLATKAGAVFGNRAGAAVVKLFREEKPNIEMSPKAIQNIINKMESQVGRAVDRGYNIQESLDEGVSPSRAAVEYDKRLKAERDAKERPRIIRQSAVEPSQNEVMTPEKVVEEPSFDQEQMNPWEAEATNNPQISSLLSKKARLAELEAMGR